MEERNDNDIEIEATEAEESHIEDTELEEGEAGLSDKLKKLKQELKRAQEEKMTALEDLARVKADFLNARKRLEEERRQDRERAKLQFVEDILPLYDSFSMALADPVFKGLPDNLQKGVVGISLQLSSILKSYDAEEVGIVGEEFDPEKHEAVANESVAASENNKVTAVMQKGFLVGGKVVRPARVTVGISN